MRGTSIFVPLTLLGALAAGAQPPEPAVDPPPEGYRALVRDVRMLQHRVRALERQMRRPEWTPKEQPPLVIYERLKPFVFNPAEETHRIASVTLHLALASRDVDTYISRSGLLPRINDAILVLLSSRSLEELQGGKFRQLKDDIREAVNVLVGEGGVTGVYFQEFVVQ